MIPNKTILAAATVTNMEAALAVLGLELVIRPIEQPTNSNQGPQGRAPLRP